MNYYSPYFGYTPFTSTTTNRGIFSSLLGGVKNMNWSGILSNIQKTLGIVNQAIPMVKQVSPIMQNAKTMFKIMNEFKKVDSPVSNKNNIQTEKIDITKNIEIEKETTADINKPTFFI